MNRNKQIIRTSLVGIAANLFLAAFKAVAGWLAGSVAIIMDAVNNLSDALSSVITIVGTKLSEKPADRNHPFGYGRVEYFSAIIISVIVLSTGIISLVESVTTASKVASAPLASRALLFSRCPCFLTYQPKTSFTTMATMMMVSVTEV